MAKETLAKTQDIDIVGESLTDRINEAHGLCVASKCNVIESAAKCGGLLLEAKKSLKHGQWSLWVADNCDFGYSTATLYIRTHKKWVSLGRQTANALAVCESLLDFVRPSKEDKGAAREEKLAAITEGNETLAATGGEVFSVILCDPPWRYEFSKSDSREIENQYPTMELDDICDLGESLASITTDDAVLFLWATSPKLADSIRVVSEWGFEYKTCAVWDKQVIGMGYYFRQQHELLLIAAKGSVPAPLPEDRPSSLFSFKRGKHSAKPGFVYELIEKWYPSLPKLEMFARKKRKGWKSWGNES